MAAAQDEIDALFGADGVAGIREALEGATGPIGEAARKAVGRNSPLSMAVTLEMLRRLRADDGDIRAALRQEYRVSHRIVEEGDFVEGVRAQIIDKDRTPHWRLAADEVTPAHVEAMLAPLGEDELAL
jgi:enoyl-CoA hydratase